MRRLAIAAATFAIAVVTGEASPLAASSLKVKAEGPAVLRRTASFTVHSAVVGRDFVVQVTTPHTPPVLPGQLASVLYVLDGGYELAGPAGWLLGGAGTMAPAYVVTVDYPPGASEREIDLLFHPGKRSNGTIAEGGGGEAFLHFLTEELNPFIAARYPVDSQRAALFGHSLSGIFTANVLTRRPSAFASYLIASPSVWADPGIIDRLAALKVEGEPRRVFVGYGAVEDDYMVDGGRRVIDALGKASGVVLEAKAFEGQQHISYYPALTTTAFPFLLPRGAQMRRPDPITLPPARLQRYLGDYALADGRRITVTQDEDGLVFKVEGREEAGLLAEAEDRFYIHGVDASIVFNAGSGPASDMVVSVNGATARARRVK
jgi:predicted alpha/beta superfamily hydrolase